MYFKAKWCTTRFGMHGIVVIENEKQALVTFDVGIVAVGRVVTSIGIDVDKRCQVFGIAFLAMRRPRQDVVRNLIIFVSVMGYELLYFGASEVPNMVKFQGSHHIRRCLHRFERPRPIVPSILSRTVCGKMKAVVRIQATNPKAMLENRFFSTAFWNLPGRTIAMVFLPLFVIGASLRNQTSAIPQDGCPDIVGLDM